MRPQLQRFAETLLCVGEVSCVEELQSFGEQKLGRFGVIYNKLVLPEDVSLAGPCDDTSRNPTDKPVVAKRFCDVGDMVQ